MLGKIVTGGVLLGAALGFSATDDAVQHIVPALEPVQRPPAVQPDPSVTIPYDPITPILPKTDSIQPSNCNTMNHSIICKQERSGMLHPGVRIV